jgi:hypothetical protein
MYDDWVAGRAVAASAAALLFFVAGYKLVATGDSIAGGLGWALYGVSALCLVVAMPRHAGGAARPRQPGPGTPAACPECGKPTVKESLAAHLIATHHYDIQRAADAVRE